MADDKPIIIIKKKGGHGGAHGGAWKVAYADFVTAMMAFFMVMWLVNTADNTTRKNIATYFRQPGIFTSGSGAPLMIGEQGILKDAFVPPHPEETHQRHKGSFAEKQPGKTGTDPTEVLKKRVTTEGEAGKIGNREWEQEQLDGFASEPIPEDELQFEPERLNRRLPEKEDLESEKKVMPGEGKLSNKPTKSERTRQEREADKALEKIKELAGELEKMLASAPDLKEMLGIVDIKVEADGLNIEVMDTDKISMFELGSARINPASEAAFAKIGALIAKLPNNIDMVGHTDAKPFSSQRGGYSNWELSADRANAARRLLEKGGVDPKRFTSVVGRADQELRVPTDPFAPSNRRITLKMRFNPALVPAAPAEMINDFPTLESRYRSERETPTAEPATPPSPAVAAPATSTADSLPSNAVVVPGPNKQVRLPREAPPTMNPGIMPRDKIFGDLPPVVPIDPFATP